MVGTITAQDAHIAYHDDEMAALSQPTVADADQIVYVQLRPGAQLLSKCIGHIKATSAAHPSVDVRLAGYTHEDHQFLLTLAINLGPRNQITMPSVEAVNAFNFVNAVFTQMFDFLPQYAATPTEDEQDRAAVLPLFLGDAAQTAPCAAVASA